MQTAKWKILYQKNQNPPILTFNLGFAMFLNEDTAEGLHFFKAD